jgi:16S rRNA (guanine966-N2)-methyltransferase
MRVIAGEARGVPLIAPSGTAVRPTSDRTKEAMFAVLGDLGCDGRVLDLFAGSGALGIEALSRGASRCDFVESSGPACRAIAANLAKTKLSDQGNVLQQSVKSFLARAPAGPPYDLILLDPPYAIDDLDALLRRVGGSTLIGPGTALMVEHARGRVLPPWLGPLQVARSRTLGDSAFTLYLAPVGPAATGGAGR